RWISAGLLCAGGMGLAAWAFGYPFLTSHSRYLAIPWIGDIPLATALIFDIGVFAVVVGTTLRIRIAIAHQSIRAPRAKKPVDAAPATPAGEPV
ncbi:MAG: MnhB domain-containing protein, partial [Burkholderiaceae bacterium]